MNKNTETTKNTATETKKVKINIDEMNTKMIDFLQSNAKEIYNLRTELKQGRNVVFFDTVESNATKSKTCNIWQQKSNAKIDFFIGRDTQLFAVAEKMTFKDALQKKMSKNEIMITLENFEAFTEFIQKVYKTEQKQTKQKTQSKKNTKKKEENKTA